MALPILGRPRVLVSEAMTQRRGNWFPRDVNNPFIGHTHMVEKAEKNRWGVLEKPSNCLKIII